MNPTSSHDSQLRRTPLYEQHLAAGANMVPFGGWEMPLHYGSQLREHLATRAQVGLFDVSHMGQLEARGAGATALVNRIVSRDVARLGDGEVGYCVLCNAEGGLVDDLMAARLGPERFLLVVNASTYEGDVALMQSIAAAARVPAAELIPCAESWAMLAVQGPAWRDCVAAVYGAADWLNMPAMRIVSHEYQGREHIISTTGYTGELGVEIMCPPDHAAVVWTQLIEAGAMPVGLAARDSLRLEKGFALSGQDFTPANNPLEAGLGWVVDLDKSDFNGLAALRELASRGVARSFVGLIPEGRRIARHGAPILADGKVVGEVTSGGFSPILEHPIALGYIESGYARPGGKVQIDLGRGTLVAAEVRRRKLVSDSMHVPQTGKPAPAGPAN